MLDSSLDIFFIAFTQYYTSNVTILSKAKNVVNVRHINSMKSYSTIASIDANTLKQFLQIQQYNMTFPSETSLSKYFKWSRCCNLSNNVKMVTIFSKETNTLNAR